MGIGNAAVIFAPSGFLSVAEKIGTGDVMMVADFGAAHAAEKPLRQIHASAVEAVCFLMVDPLHFESGVKVIPRIGLTSIDDRTFGDTRPDERKRLSFITEHGRKRIAVALADNHNALALAVASG